MSVIRRRQNNGSNNYSGISWNYLVSCLGSEMIRFDMEIFTTSMPRWVDALCAEVDPEIFFPIKGSAQSQAFKAKSICRKCPIIDKCLSYAVKHTDLDGIWGATTQREREIIRSKTRRIA
jgi:WhiB family redox-sensing transcriptional regulator